MLPMTLGAWVLCAAAGSEGRPSISQSSDGAALVIDAGAGRTVSIVSKLELGATKDVEKEIFRHP